MCISPESLQWTHWEADSSVFDAVTGETHLLSALPAVTLEMLTSGPWGFDALCIELADMCETANDSRWKDKIIAVLDGLEGLELIERIDEASPPSAAAAPSRCVDKPSEH